MEGGKVNTEIRLVRTLDLAEFTSVSRTPRPATSDISALSASAFSLAAFTERTGSLLYLSGSDRATIGGQRVNIPPAARPRTYLGSARTYHQ